MPIIIAPAIISPKAISKNARLKGMLNKNAATELDHAPLNGVGIAINANIAHCPYFIYFCENLPRVY